MTIVPEKVKSAVVAESQKTEVELSKDEKKLSDLKDKKEKSYNALLEKVSTLKHSFVIVFLFTKY